MSPWIPRVGLGLLVAVVVGSIISISVGDGGPQTDIEIEGISETQRLFGGIRQEDARVGVPDAPVEIDVFNDLRSVDGGTFQREVVEPVIEDYVRTDRALANLRHYSIGRSEVTLPALGATAAGEQGRQWQFADLVWRNLENVGPQGADAEFLGQIAETVSEFNQEQWEADFERLQDEAVDEEVETQPEADAELGAELQIPAQPSIVVTGPGGSEELIDTPTLEEVRAAIERVSVPVVE